MAKKKKDKITAKMAMQMAGGVPQRRVIRVKRNEPCPCQSGKKYKDCHAAEGDAFLQKLAAEREKRLLQKQEEKEGAPWYRRLLSRLSEP